MEIRRDIYLDKLISKKHNKLIKVITESADVADHICFLTCLRITLNQRAFLMTI